MADWPLIAIRWFLYLDFGLQFGLLLFALYALTADERRRMLPLREITLVLVLLGLLVSVVGFLLSIAATFGVGVEKVSHADIMMLLTETSFGWALIARIVGFIVLGVMALTCPMDRTGWLAGFILFASVPVASLVWSGHGAEREGAIGWVQLVNDIFHVLAASAWVGALAGFILIVSRRHHTSQTLRLAHRALTHFAATGTIIVGAIVLTGLVNSYVLLGPRRVAALPESAYGQLLLAKLALFGLMLLMAASNRYWLTPALDLAIDGKNAASAHVHIKRSLWIEAGAAILILGLVAWFGTLAPPMSGG